MSYVVSTKKEQDEMLRTLGLSDLESLYRDVPREVLLTSPLNIEEGVSEFEVLKDLEKKAAKNKVFDTSFRGGGSYRHLIPEVVKHLSSLSGFVTSYTPYQAEISQGNLQSIFEYQSEVCDLFDMEVSNASIYDGASAAAESMIMAMQRKKNKFAVAENIHPNVIEVIKTYAFAKNIELVYLKTKDGLIDQNLMKETLDDEVFGVLVQSPNYFGLIEDLQSLSEIAHDNKSQIISYVNPISSAILKTPGECGVDIVCCEGQPLGLSQGFGGPYLGIMATTSKNIRKLPGRIVGQTVDFEGKRSFVLTLQAREQHIRREKASSSICTNQALVALKSAIYLSAMGKTGLKEVASQCLTKAHYLKDQICSIDGFSLKYKNEFFHEFVVSTSCNIDLINEKLKLKGIEGPIKLDDTSFLICATEAINVDEINSFIEVLKEVSCN